MLISDFGGSAVFHLFERAGLNPYKGMYWLMVPLSFAGAMIGLSSVRKRETEDKSEAAAR